MKWFAPIVGVVFALAFAMVLTLDAYAVTEMNDANTAITKNLGEASALCQAETQDSNTDWYLPTLAEALVFAGDANDTGYIWVSNIGEPVLPGNILNPVKGRNIAVQLYTGETRHYEGSQLLEVRCVR